MLLTHAGEDPRAAAARSPQGGPWVYLGRDDLSLRRWEAALGASWRRIPVGAVLNASAERLREPYLAALAELGRRHASLEWWTSRIADEDTLAGSLFYWACALDAALTLARAPEPPVLVVAEREDLLSALAGKVPEARRSDPLGAVKDCVRSSLLAVWRWSRWALRSRRELCSAQASRPADDGLGDGRGTVLLATWAGAGYFGPDGPRDSYFGPLAKMLADQGRRVLVLPVLHEPGRHPADAFAWLRAKGGHIVAEDHYRWTDYAWAALVAWRGSRLPLSFPPIAGLDLTPLLVGERRLQRANTSKTPFILYARLVERLVAGGFRPDVLIQTWENAGAEKPLLMAASRWWPKTLRVGYQHCASLLPNMVQHFAAPDGPQPDRIVCCSRFLMDLLAKRGFPASRLRVGPSLRYIPLLGDLPERKPEPGTVLVCLSLEPGAAAETLTMVREALSGAEGVKVRVKAHPMTSPEFLKSTIAALPPGPALELVTGRVDEWASRSACAVVAGSTVAMDLALLGVPVIQVGRETSLDFDPLAYFDGFVRPVRDAASLRRELLRAAADDPAERDRLAAWARQARKDCLSPLGEDAAAAFLPDAPLGAAR